LLIKPSKIDFSELNCHFYTYNLYNQLSKKYRIILYPKF
jgi:hypothetical protein